MTTNTKMCKKCSTEKHIDEFYLDRGKPRPLCKHCMRKTISSHRYANIDKANKIARKSYHKNKHKYVQKRKQYEDENKDRFAEHRKQYVKKYAKERRRNSDQFRISANLRSRLSRAVKNDHKCGSAVGNLGCSIEELKQYLAAFFTEDMTWDNYGEWHIDHIIPLAAFDLTNEEELKKACHYTNLQPLWAKDNQTKSNKVEQGEL